MKDIQISKPVLIALLGAVLVGGYLFYSSSKSGQEIVPNTPAPTQATGSTGATSTPKPTIAQLRVKRLKALRKKAKAANIPFNVYMARRAGKEVVIFFWEPRAKDDKRVNEAVKAVKSQRSKMVVFRDRIANKSRYDGIAQAAAITQTPGLVFVYRTRADSWMGYIDEGTLYERMDRLTR